MRTFRDAWDLCGKMTSSELFAAIMIVVGTCAVFAALAVGIGWSITPR